MGRSQTQRLFPFLTAVRVSQEGKGFRPSRETGTRGVPYVLISAPGLSEKALVWFDRWSNGTHVMYSADPWALEKAAGFSVVLKDGWDKDKVTEVVLCCFAYTAAVGSCKRFLPDRVKLKDGELTAYGLRDLRDVFSKAWARARKDGYDGLEPYVPKEVLETVEVLRGRWAEFTGDDIRQARERALKELVFLASKGLSQSDLEAICGEAVVQTVMKA